MTEVSWIVLCGNGSRGLGAARLEQRLAAVRAAFGDPGGELILVQVKEPGSTPPLAEAIGIAAPVLTPEGDGRAAALGTGLAATTRQIIGVFDLDLPARLEDLASAADLVALGSCDLVVGQLTPATGSQAFRRWSSRALLGITSTDADAGCLIFSREVTASIARAASRGRARLPLTEIVARAGLKQLKIDDAAIRPVDDETFRTATHSAMGPTAFLREILQVRRRIGLSYARKSPVYWSLRGYELAQNLVLGNGFRQMFNAVAELIPEGASVTDLCCGSGKLYTEFLRSKDCSYIGMDFNSHFVRRLRKRHIDARFVDLPDDVPAPADYVVMCSSFYHFRAAETALLDRMRSAAGTAVIISEPVKNLSHHSSRFLGKLANRLTDPGVGSFAFRHDLESFRAFASDNGATDFIHQPGQPGAIAVFAPQAPSTEPSRS